MAAAARLKVGPMELCEKIYEGERPDIMPRIRNKIKDLIPFFRRLRDLALEVGAVL